MANKRSMGHTIRSIYFVDYLRDRTGLGEPTIEQTIRELWYQPNGFSPPSRETISAYFKGARPIPYDPSLTNDPPWLFAAEQQFPGCAQAFFHPLWTFLFGRLHSSAKFVRQKSKVPQVWIDECHAKGDEATAQKWQVENHDIEKTVPRKSLPYFQHDIKAAHTVMMLLPNHLSNQLLTATDGGQVYYRTFQPIEAEINLLQEEKTIDSLTAILMLVVEAAEIGDRCRLHAAKLGAEKHLEILAKDKAFRRVGEQVRRAIFYHCLYKEALSVSQVERYRWFPESWWLYEQIRRMSNLP